jgi:hypothetical protein
MDSKLRDLPGGRPISIAGSDWRGLGRDGVAAIDERDGG